MTNFIIRLVCVHVLVLGLTGLMHICIFSCGLYCTLMGSDVHFHSPLSLSCPSDLANTTWAAATTSRRGRPMWWCLVVTSGGSPSLIDTSWQTLSSSDLVRPKLVCEYGFVYRKENANDCGSHNGMNETSSYWHVHLEFYSMKIGQLMLWYLHMFKAS